MPWITPPTLTYGASFSRPTTIRPPLAYNPNRSYPLLVVLHNYGATGADMVTRFCLDEAVSFDDGAFVLCPTALPNGSGHNQWNYWSAYTQGDGGDIDYLLNGLIVPILAACPIDRKRVFLVGYSNGAFMSHQLARLRPDLFTAAFTAAGCNGTSDPSTALAHTIPWVHWHGDSDGTVLYAGDASGATLPGDLMGHGYIGGVATAALHASWNGLAGSLGAQYDTIDFVTAVAGAETSRKKYSGTTTENAVEHWIGVGVDHAISLTGTQRMGQILFTWLATNHRTT